MLTMAIPDVEISAVRLFVIRFYSFFAAYAMPGKQNS